MDCKFYKELDKYINYDKNLWITIFEIEKNNIGEELITTFCALYNGSEEDLKEYFSKADWDFSISSFGESYYLENDNGEYEYSSGVQDGMFEYLVAYRNFVNEDRYPSYCEINPKLIWFENLCRKEEPSLGEKQEDSTQEKNVEYIDPKTGYVEIRITESKIEVRRDYLQRFLAACGKWLIVGHEKALYFAEDFDIKNLQPVKKYIETKKKKNTIITFCGAVMNYIYVILRYRTVNFYSHSMAKY